METLAETIDLFRRRFLEEPEPMRAKTKTRRPFFMAHRGHHDSSETEAGVITHLSNVPSGSRVRVEGRTYFLIRSASIPGGPNAEGVLIVPPRDFVLLMSHRPRGLAVRESDTVAEWLLDDTPPLE